MNTTVKNMLLATAGAAVLMAGSTAMGSADTKITIKSGDTLSQLAIDHDATVEDLVASNNIKDANKIWAGDKLVISGKDVKEFKLTNEQKEVVAEVKEEVEVKQAEQTVEAPVATEVNTDVAVATENNTISTPVQQETVPTKQVATYNGGAPVTDRVGNAYLAGQCTAYVYDRAGFVGSYWGDARAWVGSAAAAGRKISGTATAKSVAVFAPGVQGAGKYGHVAFVESVDGGMMTISEANYNGKAYNTRTISTAGATFITR